MIRLARKRTPGGRLVLRVRARDADGVARLTLFVDGRRVRSARGARLRFSGRRRPGRHRVVVRAIDALGNRAALELRIRVR